MMSYIAYWKECIHEWYPKLQEKTYFLPPLQFRRVPYREENVMGQSVLVPSVSINVSNYDLTHSDDTWPFTLPLAKVLDSDMRDDQAQERVLHYLKDLAEKSIPKEVMIVISKLQFGKYLNKPCYSPAAAHFKRPVHLDKEFRRGDFDVLIIHAHYGLIIGEVKSVGINFTKLGLTERQQSAIINKRITAALHALRKAYCVLQHLVSDLEGVRISKFLAMPNVTSEQVMRSVHTDVNVMQDMCQTLETQDISKELTRCLCLDHIAQGVSLSAILKSDRKQKSSLPFVSSENQQQRMSDSEYEELVARFCGPATTVEICCLTPPRLEMRTEGEGVSETGERMTRLVLLPEQMELLNSSIEQMFLLGPPGTGKSVVLLLKGLSWLQIGHDVHVISTWEGSRAASHLLFHQMKYTLREWGKSHHCEDRDKNNFDEDQIKNNFDDDLSDIVSSVRNLRFNSRLNQVCVLVDEAGPIYSQRPVFTQFLEELNREEPCAFIWAASVQDRVRPPSLPSFTMSTPLRSPRVVITEVEKSLEMLYKVVLPYSHGMALTETDGPPVKRIIHHSNQLNHEGSRPDNCVECGRALSQILQELHVGKIASSKGIESRPLPLKYRDVLVLCDDVRQGKGHSDGHAQSPGIGFVLGLQECAVPVRFVETDDRKAIKSMALCEEDAVFVTHWNNVRGLERKVLVLTRSENWDYRLHGASRCSSQLIFIITNPNKSE